MKRENLATLTDEQIAAEFDREVERDPWVLDWPRGHRGRRLREESERRRLNRLAGTNAPTFAEAREAANERGYR